MQTRSWPVRALLLAALPWTALTAAGPAQAQQTASQPVTESKFVPGTEDVPLAPGLVIPAEGAVVFDQPSGRIVEATAAGPADAAGIQRFYAETLPQLGWTSSGGGQWTREGERLAIAMERRGKGTQVRFTLAPHP